MSTHIIFWGEIQNWAKVFRDHRDASGCWDGTETTGVMSSASTAPHSTSFLQWTWGGRMHMVPEAWDFPCCDIFTLWNLWWSGNVRSGRYRTLSIYESL